MLLSKRSFVQRAAAALALGVPGVSLAPAALAAAQSGAGTYVGQARLAAEWIDASAIEDASGALRWPSDPLRPEAVNPFLYSGSAGVVAFFTALGRYSGDRRWLDRAEKGARGLIADASTAPAAAGALYSGRAGVAHVLADLARVSGKAEHLTAAKLILNDAVAGAVRTDVGIEWSDCPDIVAGGAGVGLVLIRYGQAWADPALIGAAEAVAAQILAQAQTAETGGWWWSIDRTTGRNYPNFSHGTAGVAYFLAELHRATGKQVYLDAALQGATYLEGVARKDGNGALIFHRADGGLDRFYVGWCHGPVGTSRLFYSLHQITGERRWGQWIDDLTAGLRHTGAPLRASDGYWNNISQCCGNAGIAQYHVDLLRYRPTDATRESVEPIIADTLRRGTRDARGLSWVQAENRTQPENLVAQTGLMQGASGVGLLFLQLHALDGGLDWEFPLPDTPFRTA